MKIKHVGYIGGGYTVTRHLTLRQWLWHQIETLFLGRR